MVEDKWLLLASIPVVVFLVISIRRRMRDLNTRIEQLKQEEAAGPVNPYQAMYEMMLVDSTKEPDSIGSLPFREGLGVGSNSLLRKAMGKTSPPADTERGKPEDNDG